MSYQTLQEMSREQVEEIASAQQKLALQLASENDQLRKSNEKLRKSYYRLLDNTFPVSYVKHLLKVASCFLTSTFFGIFLIVGENPGSLYSALVFFIGSFLTSFIIPAILTFLCEMTGERALNEKIAPYAPYLIIPLVYLFIVMNFR